MNLSAIFSKTGKGVQEASGKTSHLSRADRAVLAAIDGKTPLAEVQKNFEKLSGPKFEALIQQLDKDGFIREVSSGAPSSPPPRAAAPAAKAPPKAAPPPSDDGSDGLDFTQITKAVPKPPSGAPKPPPVDLAAAARAEAERRAKEQQALDFRARQEAEAKAKAEAEAKARAAAAEARARVEAEAKASADAAARAQAEADAKVKAAREAAVRLAADAKAKAEAKAKADAEAAEKDKARLEAELNAKLEAERKAREEAERRAAEAAEKARKDLEEKARRDAEEMRKRLEAEMQAKLEAERKAREEEDRKRREEEDRRRKEEDERRRKEEEERRAREEAERKRREEEDRRRKEEEERRRKEEQERRAKEEAERKAREEEDRKRREAEDRRRKEEDERRRKEDEERRAREEADRRKREEEDRKRRDEDERRRRDDEGRRAKEEAERKARAAADAAASLPKIEAVAPPPAAASGGGFGDSLLADLDSFGKRDEEEQKAREEAEREAKEEKARREKEEAERKAKEEAEEKRREEDKRRRREEEERRAREEAERREREEEERRKEEEEERDRKAKEERAARQAAERAEKAAAARGAARKAAAPGDDDIPVTEEDLEADDLKRDQKVAAERARRAAREAPPVAVAAGRPRKLGKPIAIALAVLLVVGLGVLNFMPVSTAEYEKAASDATGVPVKIGSARLSVLTGVELKLENVSVGSAAKIRSARGALEFGSLFGARKAFSRIELEGVQIAQSQLGDALLGKVSGENFRVARVVVKQVALDGPLKLPPLDVDATVAGDGTLQSVKLTGGDKIVATLSPKGSDIGFEISAGSFAPPFVPALSLSEFSMKGSANRSGVTSSEFDGRVFDGVLSGSARVRWGDSWTVEGEVKARNLKMAVFAPTLVSDGRVDGRAAYSMSGGAPESLYERAHLQGEFKVDKGVLGSFDVARALQTGGAQSSGRTIFNEMSGQGVYDKGAMQFTNVVISAGALNAGASLNIDANGNLSGRIVADLKTANQKQSATLNISGKVQDPVIRK